MIWRNRAKEGEKGTQRKRKCQTERKTDAGGEEEMDKNEEGKN